jgi:hypothetical protein
VIIVSVVVLVTLILGVAGQSALGDRGSVPRDSERKTDSAYGKGAQRKNGNFLHAKPLLFGSE